MTEPCNPLTVELGRLLRQIRHDAGLTGAELGQLADLAQPTVSKIETGRVVASPATLNQVLDALCVDADTRLDLHAMLDHATTYARSRRGKARGARMHAALVERESVAREMRCFQQAMVPPLLQTAEYARHVATVTPWLVGSEITEVAAAHIVRQSILYRSERRFDFVMTESALRSGPTSEPLMTAQIDRITTLGTLDNVRIGLIPWDAEALMLPWCGFTVYDHSAASVVTYTGERVSCDPDDVDTHLAAFRAFADAALFGADARGVLARVLRDIRHT